MGAGREMLLMKGRLFPSAAIPAYFFDIVCFIFDGPGLYTARVHAESAL
jgi:hypothetical protein